MFILPVVVATVPSVKSLPSHRGVVWRVWYEVAVSMVTLLVAIVPIVSIWVMAGRSSVMQVWRVVGWSTPSEAFAQSELGRELPNRLSLVQDDLLLLDKALPKVEDGSFGLFARAPPASRRWTLMAWSAGPRCTYAWTWRREAGRVCVHGNRGAHKAWVGSKVIVRPWAGRCWP